MKNLTDEQLLYLTDNLSIFVKNVSASRKQVEDVYAIYNYITGQNKRISSCGRCWANVKKNVYEQYRKQTEIF